MLVAMAPMVVLFEGSVLLARIFRPEARAQEVVGSAP
jgi:Sec-independent protein secretion pathway component TatC